MPPILHCIRHGQGHHNLSKENRQIHDPSLTEEGEEQCRASCKAFPYHDKIELILVSPLRRTIQTALLVLQPEFERGMVALAVPDAQEVSADPCGRGSDPDKIEAEFPSRVDFRRVKDNWNSKEGRWEVKNETLEQRTRELRQFIRARPEKEIALVCHGEIMHHFEENLLDKGDDPDSELFGEYTFRCTED